MSAEQRIDHPMPHRPGYRYEVHAVPGFGITEFEYLDDQVAQEPAETFQDNFFAEDADPTDELAAFDRGVPVVTAASPRRVHWGRFHWGRFWLTTPPMVGLYWLAVLYPWVGCPLVVVCGVAQTRWVWPS